VSSAGFLLEAGRIPGERIETTTATSDSSGWTTTETVALTLVVPVIIGRTYKIVVDASYASSVDGDVEFVRIRENNVTGTTIHSSRIVVQDGAGVRAHAEVEWTAPATANKMFVLTGERESGTGTGRIDAGSINPAYLYADYLRG
jgi:hypothetical protein